MPYADVRACVRFPLSAFVEKKQGKNNEEVIDSANDKVQRIFTSCKNLEFEGSIREICSNCPLPD